MLHFNFRSIFFENLGPRRPRPSLVFQKAVPRLHCMSGRGTCIYKILVEKDMCRVGVVGEVAIVATAIECISQYSRPNFCFTMKYNRSQDSISNIKAHSKMKTIANKQEKSFVLRKVLFLRYGTE